MDLDTLLPHSCTSTLVLHLLRPSQALSTTKATTTTTTFFNLRNKTTIPSIVAFSSPPPPTTSFHLLAAPLLDHHTFPHLLHLQVDATTIHLHCCIFRILLQDVLFYRMHYAKGKPILLCSCKGFFWEKS
ncbi:unnamed protein product [Lactuca saligna]|uniref:Uncharacterized protein n=1 Tax=Lactuca saligna TaxID=75948 RepID=A0AA35ZBE6_LACSI|nr:unnamed protein product [Lactuca saligna]